MHVFVRLDVLNYQKQLFYKKKEFECIWVYWSNISSKESRFTYRHIKRSIVKGYNDFRSYLYIFYPLSKFIEIYKNLISKGGWLLLKVYMEVIFQTQKTKQKQL
uniref:hypothetical protein n=1 Tax=Russula emetica TaxID=152958 RepID=UPI0031F41378